MINKRLINTGAEAAPAAFDPIQNFETVTYTGNGGTQKITGYIRKGAAFDGSSSYIETPSLIPVNDYSFSCWVYFDSLAAASNYRVIYEAYKNTWWYLAIFDGGKIATYNGTSTFNTTSNVISTGQWYHIVYTSSSTSGKNIYLNGNSTPVATNGDTTGNSNPSGSWEGFGKYHTTGVGSMHGKIDQVRIFDKALSPSEVTTLYGETYASSTKSTTDIFGDGHGIALYELDEDANDTGGVNGNFGGAAVFNGTNSYITGSPNIGFGQSISMWFDVDSSISATQGKLWSQSIGGSTTWAGAGLYWDGSDFYFSMQVRNGAYLYQTAGIVTVNSGWNHIVFTFDSNAGYSAWLNNSELTMTTNLSSGTVSSFPAPSGTTTIGRQWGNGDDYYFKGKIDDVRIYPDKLTSQEVGYLYNNTTASIPTDYVAYYKLDGDATDETTNYDGTATNVSYGYNGTPTNVNFLGMAFQPDLVWIKKRSGGTTRNHHAFDSVRGAGNRLRINHDYAESYATDELTSFDSNGFTVSSSDATNGSGSSQQYVAWCWKAGGSAGTYNIDGTGHATLGAAGLSITGNGGNSPTFTGCSINTASGFGIYEIDPNHTASNHRTDFTHGLNSTPELVITKILDATSNWHTFTNIIDGSTDRGKLNTTDAFVDDTLNGVSVATSTEIRIEDAFTGNLDRFLFYAFHSVDGYQKVGSYTGTGSAGNTVTTGFQPRWLMIKESSNTGNWRIVDAARNTSDPRNSGLWANLNNSESDSTSNTLDFETNGFTLQGSGSDVNTLNETYIYLAIA